MNPPYRKIIHIDMDAFYASVEQHDNPELKGKPLAVGGSEKRGVVAAASYEARKYGVRSAMPGARAAEKCPHLIFVKPRFERYKEISMQIRQVFYDYTDLVEPLSLDEAFLDVTENKKGLPSATLIAKEIRKRIFQETGLTASAGISINKFLAKVASDINKPNGQKLIAPDEVISFLEELKIEKFFGVGAVTARKMKSLGIFKGGDLKQKDLLFLTRNFGKSGLHYYHIVRGEQNSPVRPNRVRKSIGAERTFSESVFDRDLDGELNRIFEIWVDRIHKNSARGKTVTLKYRYDDFETHTRSATAPNYISSRKELGDQVDQILENTEIERPVRLLGLTLSQLEPKSSNTSGTQLTLKF
jgi:DNA polymerase-4